MDIIKIEVNDMYGEKFIENTLTQERLLTTRMVLNIKQLFALIVVIGGDLK